MAWGPALTIGLGFAVWTWRLSALARARCEPGAFRPGAPFPSVSVVIPARNEAKSLPALLVSLAKLAPAPCEIIVVDDDSTDGTAALARRAGARVVRPSARPAGWLGKPWACAEGARAARGDWLLFTDADTVHGPDSLAIAVGAAVKADAGLVSVMPGHVAVSWWERLQGVFHLLLAIATRASADGPADAKGARERRYCIGQYLLFSRTTYLAVGGHASVRHRVAEDLAFAASVERAGAGYRLVAAPGLVTVRMYPGGLADFVAGWRRNFREGLRSAGLAGSLEVAAVLGWMLGLPIWTTLAVSAGDVTAAMSASLAFGLTAIEVGRRQRLVMATPPGTLAAFAFPLFAALFALISGLAVLDNLWRRPVSWKGRSIVVAR